MLSEYPTRVTRIPGVVIFLLICCCAIVVGVIMGSTLGGVFDSINQSLGGF